MINLTAEVEGGEIVRRGLEDLALAIPKVSRLRIYNAMRRVLTRMRNEPSRMASYDRTGTLRAGWPYRPVREGEIGYRIYNPVEYAHYVVGDAYGDGQAWFHVGRWEKFREVVDEEIRNLPEEIENVITLYGFS